MFFYTSILFMNLQRICTTTVNNELVLLGDNTKSKREQPLANSCGVILCEDEQVMIKINVKLNKSHITIKTKV